MIEIRHILHPVKSAKGLYTRGRRAYDRQMLSYYKTLSNRIASKMQRGSVSKCWCGGDLKSLATNAEYATCMDCGCYVNTRPPLPEGLKEFYSLDGYWRIAQKAYSTPPIEKRGELYRSDGRLDYWLDLVNRYAPKPCSAIEVGCAPGILLSELARRGYRCVGVEPHNSTAQWIRQNVGVEVHEGTFPEIELPKCDLFLSFDVAEHTPTPLGFWSGIADLLNPGGVAILQTPIERSDYENPFKDRPDFFDGIQHLYLYSDKSVEKLTRMANLELVVIEDAISTLGQTCVLRKPLAAMQDHKPLAV
jgi:2-polyprenyl-3-methyl-5-hydroxy-6-metoxy-1,4-benzoquinol methylase